MGTTSYFIRRFLLIIPTFVGITVLVFAVTRVVPGGPIERILNQAMLSGGGAGPVAARGVVSTVLSEAQLQQLRVYYGFDKPVFVSYVDWLKKVLVLDLGRSTRYNEPVWEAIKRRFPVSIFYGVTTLILTYASLHSAGDLEGDPSQQPLRQCVVGVRVPRLRDSRLHRRHRTAHLFCVAARMVSARRIRERELRPPERVGQSARRHDRTRCCRFSPTWPAVSRLRRS